MALCEDVNGGGSFALVRHVPPGNNWFAATDKLAGTSSYGIYTPSLTAATAFSVPFASRVTNSLRYLFMTGDRVAWLVASRQQLSTFTGVDRVTLTPVASSVSGSFTLFNRFAQPVDPTIFQSIMFATDVNAADKIYRL
jgi:hypothetical protein